jgi:hypothetical protein
VKVARRDLLRVGALSWMAGLWPGRAGAASYRVGIARGLDPYGAAMRAIDAAAGWPSARIAGRTVIIKPNLVAPRSPDSGAVTDPEVVRALDAIVVAGDALPRRPLQMPTLPPFVEYPRVFPAAFTPSRGQKTVVAPWYSEPSLRRLEIRRLADDVPDVQVIRTLRPWAVREVGYEIATWDGRADDGSLAAPGLYAAHVRAYHANADGRPLDGIGWIAVQEAS